uniref:Uncharacterized protein n=1 Tax=Steinernema glaseri TaxID=37863 RepID=A0A1I7YHG5_9BILA
MASQNKQFAIRTKPESSAEDSEPTKKRERTKKDVVRTVLKYYENLVEEFEDEAICKAETMIENVKGKLAHNQSRDKKSSKPVCQEVMEAFKAHRMARSSKNQAIAYDPSESTHAREHSGT